MAIVKVVNNVISNSIVASNSSESNYIESNIIPISSQLNMGISIDFMPQSVPQNNENLQVNVYSSVSTNSSTIDTNPLISYYIQVDTNTNRQQSTYIFDVSQIQNVKLDIINNSSSDINITQSTITTSIV